MKRPSKIKAISAKTNASNKKPAIILGCSCPKLTICNMFGGFFLRTDAIGFYFGLARNLHDSEWCPPIDKPNIIQY